MQTSRSRFNTYVFKKKIEFEVIMNLKRNYINAKSLETRMIAKIWEIEYPNSALYRQIALKDECESIRIIQPHFSLIKTVQLF